MKKYFSTEIPPYFSKQLHKTLKTWHSQCPMQMFNHLLLAQNHKGESESVSEHVIRNQILLEGLEQLKLLDFEAADLLQHRFLNDETAQEIAFRLNVSSNVIYQRQAKAIKQLADILWAQEIELRQQRAQQIEVNFPPPSYTKIIGIQETIEKLIHQVKNSTAPWFISLEGIGGTGKTSLADALARELAHNLFFNRIVWINTDEQPFHLSQTIESSLRAPHIIFADVIEQLVEKLDLTELKQQSLSKKLVAVREYLKKQPCFVIIDNLESIVDYHDFVGRLCSFANPSKFLLLSRHSLHGECSVFIVNLNGLSRQDTFSLVRHEAQIQGLRELAVAPDEVLTPIYSVTGGNPLVIKFIIAQIPLFSLRTILNQVQFIQGESVELLFNYIYGDAWRTLPANCRHIMQTMVQFPNATEQLQGLATHAGISATETAECLAYLVSNYLVTVTGDLNSKFYALHPLTRNYVLWQTASQDIS